MNPHHFVPLVTVSHDYFGAAMQDLTASVWSGNVDRLRRLTPRLTAAHGSVGLLLPRSTSPGLSPRDLCACLRELPIFGWEMIPSSRDFAACTDWPYRLSEEHPLLELPANFEPGRESSASVRSLPPLRWIARRLERGEKHLIPLLAQEEKPLPAMADAWGNTQEKILVRGRPSFSAFTTGAQLADLIEAVISPGVQPPRVAEAHWPAARAYWAYHISGYKNLPELTIDDADSFSSAPTAFLDLTTDLATGTRSFISREPQPFFQRNTKAFRLRANGRDLIETLPVPSPRPLRRRADEQPVSDIFVHL